MEFLNSNAGGIQAFSALLILIATTVYVFVSIKMLKELKIQRKRLEEPDLVYYLKNINNIIYGVIENIGNGIADKIKTDIEPKENIEEKEILKTIEFFSYLAPKQSISFNLGMMNIMGNPCGFDKHTMTLKWSNSKNGGESIRIYNIDENQIKCLCKTTELQELTSELSKIKKALEKMKQRD